MRSLTILLCLVAVTGCGTTTAPIPPARIVGRVTTPTRGAQPAVGVDLAPRGYAATVRSTATDSSGQFSFDSIEPGLWTVSLEPRTLAAGILTPRPLDVRAIAGQPVDASFVLGEVEVAGNYSGTATAQATGAISDTLATLGHTFFPAAPYLLGLVLTPLDGRAFLARWTGGDRQFGGRMVLAGSSVDSMDVTAVDPIPGVGNLECRSPVPNPSVIVLEQDSLTSRARFAGTLVTNWFYDSLGGGLKHESVSIDFDVTHE